MSPVSTVGALNRRSDQFQAVARSKEPPAAEVIPYVRYKEQSCRQALSRFYAFDALEGPSGEIKAFCPLCEDPETSKSPSAELNFRKNKYYCHSGGHGGRIDKLMRELIRDHGFNFQSERKLGENRDAALRQKSTDRLANGLEKMRTEKIPSPEQVERWVQALTSNLTLLEELLTERGITAETVRKWDIGWDERRKRYTIPVYNADREIINIRRYKIKPAKGEAKFKSIYGTDIALFGLSILQDADTVVLTEGETDCMLLNQHGIKAVTHTGGAKNWPEGASRAFRGKNVFICYDNDDAGRLGAQKARGYLRGYAKSVTIMELPVEKVGGDVTDFLHVLGHSPEEFTALMTEASPSDEIEVSGPLKIEGKPVSLEMSRKADYFKEVLELKVSVVARTENDSHAPRNVRASCGMTAGKKCAVCPVGIADGQLEKEIRPDDRDLAKFLLAPGATRAKLVRESLGTLCSDRVDIEEIGGGYRVEELEVEQSLDHVGADEDYSESGGAVSRIRTIYSVSENNLDPNQTWKLVGHNVVGPKDSSLYFLAWHAQPLRQNIDNVKLTNEMRERLKQFQPAKGQRPLEKCREIADELAASVTGIIDRPNLHIACDLVWHSVLHFNSEGKKKRGWIDAMIIGDSRTGKTDVARGYLNHYQSGMLRTCEGASLAGLVGGVDKAANGNKSILKWGVLPHNDRRLVVLDEASGLNEEAMDKLSTVRSDGVAQISKIQGGTAKTRTRLLWITNARTGTVTDLPEHGLTALRQVVPKNEDIARFDFVMAVGGDELDGAVLHDVRRSLTTPKYSSEDCEALVKWIWSLDDPSRIVVKPETAKRVNELAKGMGSRYIPQPPLIQIENVREKILRIACAIAARTFSVTRGGNLEVLPEHAEDAVEFLDTIYRSKNFDYARISRRAKKQEARARSNYAECKASLGARKDVRQALEGVGSSFRAHDLSRNHGIPMDVLESAIADLRKWGMVSHKGNTTVLDPALLSVLRELEDEDLDLDEENA